MRKILFITIQMGGGGSERFISYLMNYLSSTKQYDITLLLLKKAENEYLSDLDKGIKIINIASTVRVRYNIFEILKQIKLVSPDICFLSLDKLNICLSPFICLFSKNIRFVVRETNILSKLDFPNHFFYRLLYRLFYSKYKLIIAQSEDMRKDLIENFYVKEQNIIKINNPVDVEKIENKILESSEKTILDPLNNNFIMVGRLTYQKGYDILLKRMSENKDINYQLFILGKGELENEIISLIEKFDLTDRVHLLGHQKNPYIYMKASNALILSSRFEGFPNVLLEANALGLPVLVNDCLGGINEIVVNGENGFVTAFENTQLFREVFEKFISYKFDKQLIRQNAIKRFSIEKILAKYKKELDRL
ncbi:glycosyltransferase [Bacteroides bouchesdurhonensis]